MVTGDEFEVEALPSYLEMINDYPEYAKDWSLYVNGTYDYSFKYPDNWMVNTIRANQEEDHVLELYRGYSLDEVKMVVKVSVDREVEVDFLYPDEYDGIEVAKKEYEQVEKTFKQFDTTKQSQFQEFRDEDWPVSFKVPVEYEVEKREDGVWVNDQVRVAKEEIGYMDLVKKEMELGGVTEDLLIPKTFSSEVRGMLVENESYTSLVFETKESPVVFRYAEGLMTKNEFKHLVATLRIED